MHPKAQFIAGPFCTARDNAAVHCLPGSTGRRNTSVKSLSLVDVRFEAHYGLKSDIAPCPQSPNGDMHVIMPRPSTDSLPGPFLGPGLLLVTLF